MRQPPEGPPICTALNFSPFFTPPPMSKMISRRVVPMGTSIRPVFSMEPVREKVLVPGLPAVPMERYHSAPSRTMRGTLAKVSTLLRTVGFSHKPFSTVRGGLTRGMPRLPSMEAVRAEPSPQTKAPAPRLMWRWKEKSVPRMLSPRRPASSSSWMAWVSRATDMGYSART